MSNDRSGDSRRGGDGGGGENSESQLFDVLNDEHSDSRLFGSSIKGEKKLELFHTHQVWKMK